MSPEIMTTSGDYFNFLQPDENSFTIEDIAHALSHVCRFGGHCSEFYSVAQHSVLVSYLVKPEYALLGLLHDAQEAFLGDIPSPLKQILPEYKRLEAIAERTILHKFGLSYTTKSKDNVKQADVIALATEKRDLLPANTDSDAWSWINDVPTHPLPIHPINSRLSRIRFLQRFYELTE